MSSPRPADQPCVPAPAFRLIVVGKRRESLEQSARHSDTASRESEAVRDSNRQQPVPITLGARGSCECIRRWCPGEGEGGTELTLASRSRAGQRLAAVRKPPLLEVSLSPPPQARPFVRPQKGLRRARSPVTLVVPPLLQTADMAAPCACAQTAHACSSLHVLPA